MPAVTPVVVKISWYVKVVAWVKAHARKPSSWTLVGSLVAGVLAVLNQTVIKAGSEWYQAITVALVFLSGIGISPLVGAQFRAALHLSARVSLVIASGMATVTVAISTFHFDGTIKTVLVAALTFLAGLGFAPVENAEARKMAKLAKAYALVAARARS